MIIYKVTNTINGKCYIGQTIKSLVERKKGHKRSFDRLSTHFSNAIRKYGWDSFTWEVLCECDTKDELDEMEFHYIKQYGSITNGYNMGEGGEGGNNGNQFTKNGKFSIDELYNKEKVSEIRRKISEAHSGENHYFNKMSEEDRETLREKRRYYQRKFLSGRVFTEDERKSMSERTQGEKNPFYGKKHTKESREKMKGYNVGCKSPHSKTLEITFPDGHKEIITGIREFARKYGLRHTLLIAVAQGKQTHHKQYKCKYV